MTMSTGFTGPASAGAAAMPGPRPAAAALESVFQHAAVINATLLKLSSLDQPGLDVQIYRSVLDSCIKELEHASTAYEIRKAEQRIARSTQLHLRAREELLSARDAEYTATVEILSDAVVQFKDTDQLFVDGLLERSNRMKQVMATDDLNTLRARMTKELTELREETIAKQEAQSRQLQILSAKVSTLEAKLNVVNAQAQRDAQTGLYNRTAWNQRMAELAIQLEEGDDAFAVALIEIDHLVRLLEGPNQTLADAVLAEFGEFCRQAFGNDDFVARFGAEEFVALIAVDGPDHATEHLDRLFTVIRRTNETERETERTPFTVSVGMVASRKGDRVHALLKRASTALAAAREGGRDRLVIAAL
ncbi:MAG TPA: diguanylate cyclase [Dehalococcoidia bacterium]|nr:diguanylate cyclase [Dehalococcoidia bacterium]